MRHKKAQRRDITPDTVYQNRTVTKFINGLMHDGKRTVAEKVFYDAMERIAKSEQNPLEVFEKALGNVSPKVEVKARRVGGASYQIPVEVRGERKVSLAIRWIIEAARSRSSREYHTMAEKLAAEFTDVIENKGEAVKKRDTMHRQAEANRAFAHFRW